MTAPRFSVVVPALDEAATLPATLASLLAQDYPGAYEVVVVDNGSRDETAAVARARGVAVVVEPRPGVCAARQRGTDEARGEIVVSTDADTRHPRDWLRRLDAVFRDHPEAVAVAGPCRYADPPWWAAVVPPLWFAALGALYARTGKVAYLTATNVAFRRVGFPGYDVTLTQGGDEVDLLRRLRRWGPLVWRADLEVVTSSRRMRQGLLHTLLVSYGWYYVGSRVLGRLTGRPVVAPAIRPADEPTVRRRRRRWRVLALAGAALLATRLLRRRGPG